MPSNLDNVILTFPPRPISQWERAVLAEWFAATKRKGLDIAEAFVSERRGDDPMIVGRIVIVVHPNSEPSHVIYSPSGSTFWVVSSVPCLDRPAALPHVAGCAELGPARAGLADSARGAERDSDIVW